MASLESRIAYIRDLAQRGGVGATLAARDAAMIVELALRELLRRYAKELPSESLGKVEQAISQQAKGGRGKTVGDFTLGQLVGVIRESRFFDLWADATGKPLMTLRMINLDALNAFRNKHLTHVADFEQLTDPAAQVSPGTAQFLLHCVDELVKAFGIESLESLPPEPGPADLAQLPDIGQSPYVGLRPFEARHHNLFFGREQESEELYQQVLSQPFVALIGNSGSGKSSLLGAGLLPRLPTADWRVIRLQPRTDVFDSLAASLVPALYPDPAEQAAQREKLARLLAEPDYRLDHLLHSLAGPRRVLLLVDQFEEVFTLSADRPRQRHAVELLLTMLRGEAMTLLLSLRADYFGHCLDLDPLRQTLARWPALTLGAMGEAALLAAITRPAEQSGLSLEDGLAETIVADLGDEPGQLPLLQTALDELWQRSDRRKLTHAGYRAIGGVAHALARKADEFLARYDNEGQDRLRRIFLQLIRPGEGEKDTRQLATEAQVGAENWELVTQLASARLVVTGRMEQTDSVLKTESVSTTTVELAHEALIRHWQTLCDWIAEDRAFRLWQNKLRDSRAEWAGHAQDDGYLLRGAKLLEAEERLTEKSGWLAEDEKAFIAASAALRQREADEKERQRRERERLQKRVLYTIAAALVVALALTGVAGWQWRAAAARKAQAEENFRKARQAVDEFYTQVSENKLLNTPNMENFRQDLLEKALKYYQYLSDQRTNDSEMRETLADAALQVGNIKRDLGDNVGAAAAYHSAMEIFGFLEREHPGSVNYQNCLAKIHDNLAFLQWKSGYLAEARESYRKGLEIRERQVREHPELADFKNNLAISHNSLGRLQSTYGDKGGAKNSYREALEIQERLVREHPKVAQYQNVLAISHTSLGLLQNQSGELVRAQESYRKALNIREQLALEYPNEPQNKRELASIYNSLGLMQNASGDIIGAGELYKKALDIQERLVQEYPKEATYQNDLAKSYTNLGSRQSKSGDIVGAKESYLKAIEIGEQLWREYPRDAEYQNDLSISYISLASFRQKGGDAAGAQESYQKALEIQDRLVRQHSEVPQYQSKLAESYINLGKLQAARGDTVKARESFQKALNISDPLAREHPAVSEYQLIMSMSQIGLGMLQGDSVVTMGSEGPYQKAVKVFEYLARGHPEVSDYQFYLANGYMILGSLHKKSGDAAGTQEFFLKALEIQERQVLKYPDIPQYRSFLTWIYNNVGSFQKKIGDLAGARESYLKAVEILEWLVQRQPEVSQYQSELAFSLKNLGLVQRDKGDSVGARESYQKVVEIRERLAREHPEVPENQDLLAYSYNSLANLQRTGSELRKVQDTYRKALKIRERLVREHPEVRQYQTDLANSYINLAYLQNKGGDEAEAKEFRQKALVVRERLVQEYPDVPQYQSDLADSYKRLGNFQSHGGDAVSARESYRKAIEIHERLVSEHPDIQEYKSNLARSLGSLAFAELFARQPQEAVTDATRALELDSGQTWINTNLAHGLLFDGQYEKALAIYMENKVVKLPENDNKTFAEAVLDDFKQLRAKGITHPDMAKIEKLLHDAVPGKP